MKHQRIVETPRLTLVQAAALPQDEWEQLWMTDLALTASDRAQVASVWHWLCGVPEGAPSGARVGNEVLADAPLLVALSLPATEFLDWLSFEDWTVFDSTERTGSEEWVGEALRRARAACDAMGSMAAQFPLRICDQP